MYLLKPGTSQNDPRKIAKRPKTIQNFEIREICNFLLVFVLQISSQMSKFRPLGPKSINFLIFQQNLTFTLFRRCWSQIWHLFSKILSPNAQFWAFWVKKYWLSNLNELYLWHDSQGADFKSDIRFQKVWAGTSKLGLFRPKDINFLILTKFCLCLVSKVLI